MKKFITIEGIDGVGKSTISKKLAENMGAEFIQTPYFKKHAEKDCEDKFSYYLDDLIQLKSILKEELKEKTIICDRYIHSTIAYQGNYIEPKLIMDKYDLLIPDLTVYLTVDEKTRLARLKIRETQYNFVNELDHDYVHLKHVSSNFNKMKDMMIIDTSTKTIDQVVKIIKEAI